MFFWLCLVLLSWLAMQIVHELGHVLAAVAVGGTIVRVTLHPWQISETVVSPKPFPELVIWSGPLLGSALPCLLWRWPVLRRSSWEACWRFFAGVCLIANGAYLGSAAVEPVGDAFDLVQLGTPVWQLVLFGVVTVPAGILCWDGLPRRLGVGVGARPPSTWQTVTLAACLAGLVAIELVTDSWM